MFQPTTLPWNIQGPIVPPQDPRHGRKRKSLITPETILVPPPPVKHFVTEEEMTAEMRRLQIAEQAYAMQEFLPRTSYSYDPNYSVRSNEANVAPFAFNSEGQFNGFGMPSEPQTVQEISGATTSFDVFNEQEMVNDTPDTGIEKESMPRLFVSEEIMKIKPQPVLPLSLISTISPRQMALVPWKPPAIPKLEEETNKNDDEMEC